MKTRRFTLIGCLIGSPALAASEPLTLDQQIVSAPSVESTTVAEMARYGSKVEVVDREQIERAGPSADITRVLQVALALAGRAPVALEHLPDSFFVDLPGTAPLADAPSADLAARLKAANGNVSQLARQLGVSRTTLYKRLQAQGLLPSS